MTSFDTHDQSSPTILEYLDNKEKEKDVISNVNSLLQNFKLKKIKKDERKKPFAEEDTHPFSTFDKCDPLEDENYIFENFKNWLAEQHELFLTTYEEPQKEPCAPPHFHTGITKEQKEAKASRKEKEKEEQEKLDKFVHDRLRLLNNLLMIYRRVREASLAASGELGRKEHAIIASTVVKQMALEYLYIHVQKCRMELYQIDPHDPRADDLSAVADYTARTAEKLRCLIERECDDKEPADESQFNTEIIHNMARMYLSEVERIAVCKKPIPLTTLPTKSESSDEKIVRELSAAEDSQVDESSGADEGPVQELELLLAGEGDEHQLDGEIEPSEPLAEARDLLRTSGEMESFDAANFLLHMRKRLYPPPHPCSAEAARAQAFKRRLWAANCFHFYSHKVVPSLGGRYRLVHQEDLVTAVVAQSSMEGLDLAGEDHEFTEQSNLVEPTCCCDQSYSSSLSPSMVKCECDCDTHTDTESNAASQGEDGLTLPEKNRFREVIKHFVSYFQDLPADQGEEAEEDSFSAAERIDKQIEAEWPWWNTIGVGTTANATVPDVEALEACGAEAAAAAANDFSDANSHYLEEKPEVWAIVVLLLREFLIEQPTKDYESFARNKVSNKNFASHLGNYLLATNEDFRRKHLAADPKCCIDKEEDETEVCRQYRFGRSDAEWWKLWGIDCSSSTSDKKSASPAHRQNLDLNIQKNADAAGAAREAAFLADLVPLWEFPAPLDPCLQ